MHVTQTGSVAITDLVGINGPIVTDPKVTLCFTMKMSLLVPPKKFGKLTKLTYVIYINGIITNACKTWTINATILNASNAFRRMNVEY